ncbi:hypothetical protein [Pseudomonas fontis]|uniref:Uncharacterized protein n=1 Tax=Pseudomonas fontis TaxID=2942633 RepID=A0ABT5NTJ8_9PSED|nr:hypothetical protein [Pseudomonas fontis]MDD0974273.1 hypothetical protein [Pseudomonas fontis]MDD0991498.1 hypothetical protein [Pseudomonas fontis]
MSNKKALAELVAASQGKSMTYGWDALTLYDQRKANELLYQLYVERFTTENGYISPASFVAAVGGGSNDHMYNLKFSSPYLSFEQSDPTTPAPKTTLTLNMIGGVIVSTREDMSGPPLCQRGEETFA